MRADLRKSFDLSSTWSLSVGAGGTAWSKAARSGAPASHVPDVDLGRLHGWGADVPVLVGYQSDGDLYMFWVGARGGWEHVNVDDRRASPAAADWRPAHLALGDTLLGRWIVGAAVGFRHLHVAMELDVSYASVSGYYDGTHATVEGVTLAPAAALWWLF